MVQAISGGLPSSAVGSWLVAPPARTALVTIPSGLGQADRWDGPVSAPPLSPLPPLFPLQPLPTAPVAQDIIVTGEEATQDLSAGLAQAVPQLSGLRVTFQPGNIVQISGSYRMLFNIPFTLTGLMGVTPDGKASIQITDIRPLNAAKGPLLSNLRGHESQGLEVRGELIVLDPRVLAPPGRPTGFLRSLTTTPDGLVRLSFG